MNIHVTAHLQIIESRFSQNGDYSPQRKSVRSHFITSSDCSAVLCLDFSASRVILVYLNFSTISIKVLSFSTNGWFFFIFHKVNIVLTNIAAD